MRLHVIIIHNRYIGFTTLKIRKKLMFQAKARITSLNLVCKMTKLKQTTMAKDGQNPVSPFGSASIHPPEKSISLQ